MQWAPTQYKETFQDLLGFWKAQRVQTCHLLHPSLSDALFSQGIKKEKKTMILWKCEVVMVLFFFIGPIFDMKGPCRSFCPNALISDRVLSTFYNYIEAGFFLPLDVN